MSLGRRPFNPQQQGPRFYQPSLCLGWALNRRMPGSRRSLGLKEAPGSGAQEPGVADGQSVALSTHDLSGMRDISAFLRLMDSLNPTLMGDNSLPFPPARPCNEQHGHPLPTREGVSEGMRV